MLPPVTVERYRTGGRWLPVGTGRSVLSVVRRVYGRRYGYQPDAGVPEHGLLIRYVPSGGASVEGRIRWGAPKDVHAVALGRRGGQAKSDAKTAAAKRNIAKRWAGKKPAE